MKKSFLLVDDDADDAGLFCEAMKEADSEAVCHLASHGEEALEILERIEAPDIIFLDINMPRMNGWECLAELKTNDAFKEIPVIMYSTSSYQREIDIASEAGALCFFSKPDNFKDLKKMLRFVISLVETNTLLEVCEPVKNLKHVLPD
jgi:CheY-like chemotaxis protein